MVPSYGVQACTQAEHCMIDRYHSTLETGTSPAPHLSSAGMQMRSFQCTAVSCASFLCQFICLLPPHQRCSSQLPSSALSNQLLPVPMNSSSTKAYICLLFHTTQLTGEVSLTSPLSFVYLVPGF